MSLQQHSLLLLTSHACCAVCFLLYVIFTYGEKLICSTVGLPAAMVVMADTKIYLAPLIGSRARVAALP